MIFNLILLIAGIIGFMTAGITFKNYKLNSTMNIYIVLILIIISTRYFLFGMSYFIDKNATNSLYLYHSNLSIIAIPLFYLYIKNLNKSTSTFEKKELYHFVFPIFFYNIIIISNYLKINFQNINFLFYSIFISYLVLYLILCYLFLKKNIWLKKDSSKILKRQNLLNSNWAYFFFLAMVSISLRLIISLFYELTHESAAVKGSNYLWISALIWLVLLIKILISPEILYGYNALHKKMDENRTENLNLNSIWDINPKIKINNTQHLQLKEKVDSYILTYIEKIESVSITEKIFRDPNITITDIAHKLNIPKSHLAYLFKYHSTISFCEYKKAIRIKDAIQLIKEDYLKENTLDYLSKKIGFPSYNTFFTSFKEISGRSPLEYCRDSI
jgi:AraC-like DNA-binding protein